MRIGIAGCGQMGRPMGEALIRAGYDVLGFDVRPPADFADSTLPVTDDIASFAATRDTLFTIVRDIPQTEALLFDSQALLEHAPDLATLVICSTVSPRYVTDLAARLPAHVTLVDAPMSGAPVAARTRKLSFMLGGDSTTLDSLMPLFQAMGTKHHRLGPTGRGMTAKVLNNLVAASSVVATRNALAWGAAQGMPPETLRAVLHDSAGQTWFGTRFEDIAFARETYDPANTIGILVKDVQSALDAARATPSCDPTLAEALIAALKALPDAP